MGVFDIVPGISGDTVALIVGIYARLVASIRNAAAAAVLLLRGDVVGMRARFRQVAWGLVLPLGVGILTALIVGALVIEQLLEAYPAASRALFFGLIAASVPLPWRRMSQPDGHALGIAAVFAVLAFLVTAVPPLTVEDPALILVFLVASVAICAMILPGLSGAFLLLIFGMYTPTMAAISDRNLLYIAVFGAGAVLGLGLFSQLLEWLLQTRRNATMAALVGLMVGSLRVLWPWQTEDRDFLAHPGSRGGAARGARVRHRDGAGPPGGAEGPGDLVRPRRAARRLDRAALVVAAVRGTAGTEDSETVAPRLPRPLEDLQDRVRGLRAGDAVGAVHHEERHTRDAEPPRLVLVRADLLRVDVARQELLHLDVVEPGLGSQPHQGVPVADRLALAQVRREKALLHLVLHATVPCEVQQSVRVERVAGAGTVEAEIQPVAGGGLGHVVLHRLRVVVARPILAGQVLG